METRSLDSIIIGERHRKDFGGVDALAASIAAVGLLQPPGITSDGRLLWGECRLRACRRLGWREIQVIVRDVDPNDMVAIEAAENFARSDFTLSEAVAIKRDLQPNLPKFGKSEPTREIVATRTGFSHETLRKAEAVVAAAEAAPQYASLVTEMDKSGRVDPAFKQLRTMQARDEYQQRRRDGGKVDDLVALAASGYRAAVIYADPPWRFETWGERGKIWTAADHHYDAMTLNQIKALPVEGLAARDCALYLWSTWPVLPQALSVLQSWNFTYKTLGFNWIKTNPKDGSLFWGCGYTTRSNSEVCLHATRGSPQRMAADVHQVVMAPVGPHSEKPDEVHDRIERLFNGPYLELFARKRRPGWESWGDEVPNTTLAAE